MSLVGAFPGTWFEINSKKATVLHEFYKKAFG